MWVLQTIFPLKEFKAAAAHTDLIESITQLSHVRVIDTLCQHIEREIIIYDCCANLANCIAGTNKASSHQVVNA